MRLSITAISAQKDDTKASPIALDGTTLKTRLGAEDAAFDTLEADPREDLAEQVDDLLASRAPGPRDAVVLYASSPALLSVDGELFLCFDPKNPSVGDSVADVVAVLSDRAKGPKLVILDLVDGKLGTDGGRVSQLVAAADAALSESSGGIELLLAVRPRSTASAASEGSPFAQAIVAEIDALDRGRSLTARSLFERLSRKLADVVPCLHHVRAKVSFDLVPLRPSSARRDSSASLEAAARPSASPPPGIVSEAPPQFDANIAAFRDSREEPHERLAIPPPGPTGVTSPSFRPPPPDEIDLAWADDVDWGKTPHTIPLARPLSAPPGASLPPPPPLSSTGGFDMDTPIASPMSGREISPFARYTIEGELLASQGDADGAIASFRKALSVLGPAGDPSSRAEMYVRIGELRTHRGDPEDAISDFEKALALRPGHIPALESLLLLCAAERDWRGVMSAEERLLAALPGDTLRFERLIEFASRWEGEANKPARARLLFERAREIRPTDPIVLEQIRRILMRSLPPPLE